MKKLLAILLLCLAGWAWAGSSTPNCKYPYTNIENQNIVLDKLDAEMAKLFVNCNTAFPLFAGVTTTTSTSSSTSSSTSTSTSSTTSTSV